MFQDEKHRFLNYIKYAESGGMYTLDEKGVLIMTELTEDQIRAEEEEFKDSEVIENIAFKYSDQYIENLYELYVKLESHVIECYVQTMKDKFDIDQNLLKSNKSHQVVKMVNAPSNIKEYRIYLEDIQDLFRLKGFDVVLYTGTDSIMINSFLYRRVF